MSVTVIPVPELVILRTRRINQLKVEHKAHMQHHNVNLAELAEAEIKRLELLNQEDIDAATEQIERRLLFLISAMQAFGRQAKVPNWRLADLDE